jgi:mRNA-degrading endonuclease RelE of RelBE toxin-antitoxin system
MYKVAFSKDAARTLEKLTPQMQRRIITALEKIKANPLKGKRLRGGLEGLFSLRIGEMRVVYEADSAQHMIVVHGVGSRGDIYKK